MPRQLTNMRSHDNPHTHTPGKAGGLVGAKPASLGTAFQRVGTAAGKTHWMPFPKGEGCEQDRTGRGHGTTLKPDSALIPSQWSKVKKQMKNLISNI